MKKLLFVISIASTSYALTAQNTGGSTTSSGATGSATLSAHTALISKQSEPTHSRREIKSSLSNNNYWGAKSSYTRVQGSPYFTDKPIKANLLMANGTLLEDIPVHIDLYAEEVVATNKKDQELLLDCIYYEKISFPHKGKEVVFKKVNKENPTKFYQLLYEDENMAFFIDNYIYLQDGKELGVIKVEPKFSKKKKYYFRYGDKQISKSKLKKKDILKLIPEAELEALRGDKRMKDIKLKNESDFVAFFEGKKK